MPIQLKKNGKAQVSRVNLVLYKVIGLIGDTMNNDKEMIKMYDLCKDSVKQNYRRTEQGGIY